MRIKNWFRLSLRDLFWATALIAVAMGWYLDHRRIAEVRDFLGIVDSYVINGPPHRLATSLTRRGQELQVYVQPKWPHQDDE